MRDCAKQPARIAARSEKRLNGSRQNFSGGGRVSVTTSNYADKKFDCFAVFREHNCVPGMNLAIDCEFDVSAAKPFGIFDFH